MSDRLNEARITLGCGILGCIISFVLIAVFILIAIQNAIDGVDTPIGIVILGFGSVVLAAITVHLTKGVRKDIQRIKKDPLEIDADS